jgi:hypothetical protein
VRRRGLCCADYRVNFGLHSKPKKPVPNSTENEENNGDRQQQDETT